MRCDPWDLVNTIQFHASASFKKCIPMGPSSKTRGGVSLFFLLLTWIQFEDPEAKISLDSCLFPTGCIPHVRMSLIKIAENHL